MYWIWDNAEKIGSLSQVVTTLIASIAVFLAFWQVTAARRAQREATAKSLYRDYLKLAFENPTLAIPGSENKKLIEQDDYRWFVSILLNACDEILYCIDDDIWRTVVATELRYHTLYLRSKFFIEDEGWNLYSKSLHDVSKMTASS
jgi:hypothetical protein